MDAGWAVPCGARRCGSAAQPDDAALTGTSPNGTSLRSIAAVQPELRGAANGLRTRCGGEASSVHSRDFGPFDQPSAGGGAAMVRDDPADSSEAARGKTRKAG